MEETYLKVGIDTPKTYWQSIKTQYAGVAVHKFFVELLRYHSTHYFLLFEVTDETIDWNTNDEEVLKQQFQKYVFAIPTVTDALAGLKQRKGQITTDLAERIEEVLRKCLKK